MAFFMLLYRWLVVDSFFGDLKVINNLNFYFLVVFLTLSAGLGFLINDYYDQETDQANGKNNPTLGLKSKQIWQFYFIGNILIALGTALVLWNSSIFHLYPIYLVSVFLLWYYSFSLKKKVLLGNLLISIFISGLVIFILPFIEWYYSEVQSELFLIHLLFLTTMSFLINFLREIIKDKEDEKGDLSTGAYTLANQITNQQFKTLTIGLLVLIAVFIGYFFIKDGEFRDEMNVLEFFSYLFMFIPSVYFIVGILLAKNKKDYHKISSLLKLWMFLGINLVLWIIHIK
jgi:4-hydroxybenzoate polyprenyltransferase